jgi:hypothetical protein
LLQNESSLRLLEKADINEQSDEFRDGKIKVETKVYKRNPCKSKDGEGSTFIIQLHVGR